MTDFGLNQLKEIANQDRLDSESQEIGFADGIIDGEKVVVTAKKVGYNQPGRKENTRYSVNKVA